MGWANELYNVYDVALKLPKEENRTLLPVSHSTANAQIEVSIDENGNFTGGSVVFDNRKKSGKDDQTTPFSENEEGPVTVIPVTEDSGARSSGITPHPLADKLIYTAGDYCDYCDGKKDDGDKYQAYIKQLADWSNSEFSHPSVKAVYKYLSKGTLIEDLVKAGVLKTDGGKKLTNDKIEKIEQKDCFVRFSVNGNSMERRTWLDKTLYGSFNKYLVSKQTDKGFCYATGEQTAITYKHPSKILNAGDKGKLFSANDETGFTYKGRFFGKEQVFAIGYEFSQKMHNSLKWLIESRGVYVGGMQIVAWNDTLSDVPNVCAGSDELIEDDYDCGFFGGNDDKTDFEGGVVGSEIMFANYKNALKKAVFGEKSIPDYKQKIMVMILDEATTGRVSVSMYKELMQSDFYGYIEEWHEDTAWERFNPVKKRSFVGSYSLPTLADLAFGTEQNGIVKIPDNLKKETVVRLIPCVIEGRKLPKDILRNLVNRASRPLSYSSKGNWRKVLGAACGMIRKTKIEKGENCTMALNENCNNRDYLYGRLLAVAEVAERSTYNNAEDRPTNAERYFEKFSNSPAATWAVISNRLSPYFDKMSPSAKKYYKTIIDEIMDKFASIDEFNDNTKLKPEYLLAYSCQRKKLYTKNYNKNNNEEEK